MNTRIGPHIMLLDEDVLAWRCVLCDALMRSSKVWNSEDEHFWHRQRFSKDKCSKSEPHKEGFV